MFVFVAVDNAQSREGGRNIETTHLELRVEHMSGAKRAKINDVLFCFGLCPVLIAFLIAFRIKPQAHKFKNWLSGILPDASIKPFAFSPRKIRSN